MATLRKRGDKWHTQVRLKGHPAITKSFFLKSDAEAWGRQQEVALECGDQPAALPQHSLNRSVPSHSRLDVPDVPSGVTLGSLLVRYEAEVVSRKRSAPSEGYMISTIKKAIGTIPLEMLTASVLARYRDTRLMVVRRGVPLSPSSVRRELAIIQHCLEVARKEWGVTMPGGNPMSLVTKPTPARARTRRLTTDDALKVAEGLKTSGPLLTHVIHFAIGTGMRRGEILSLLWSNINENNTAYLPLTKNGESRTVPLSPSALMWS
jgi:hypothetical protein